MRTQGVILDERQAEQQWKKSSATRKLKNHHYLWWQSRRKMPSKSMQGNESKKMRKEKPLQNTEKKGTDILYRKIWKPVKEKRKRKKKKKKETEKGKTASVHSDTLGRERPAPSWLLWRFGTSHYTDES